MADEATGAESQGAGPASEGALDAQLEAIFAAPEGGEGDGSAGQPAENPAPDTAAGPGDPSDASTADDPTTEPGETPGEGDPNGEGDDEDTPADLKAIRSKLSRTEYRKLMEAAEARQADRLKAAQEAADSARRDREERERSRAETIAKRGRFVAADDFQYQDDDGNTVRRPGYDKLVKLLTTPGGYRTLDREYGLSVTEAQTFKTELDDRRAMLDASLDDQRDAAWQENGRLLALGVAEAGLPTERIFEGVRSAKDVVAKVVDHLKAEHAAELSRVRRDLEGRLRAATANGTTQAGKAAAKALPAIETGGRSDASAPKVWTTSAIDGLSSEQFRAHQAEIEAAMDQGRVVPG